MVLQTNETCFLLSSAIQKQIVGNGPFILAEFAVIQQFLPLGSPQMVLQNSFPVLEMGNSPLVNQDLRCVPFPERLCLLTSKHLNPQYMLQTSIPQPDDNKIMYSETPLDDLLKEYSSDREEFNLDTAKTLEPSPDMANRENKPDPDSSSYL